MSKTTTDKLYVDLSASQARKRVKGHGCGVKRVEAAGRNQSVVVHTATGDHLRELEALFSDVLTSTSQEDLGVQTEDEDIANSPEDRLGRHVGEG